jgi:Flp pilus assembly pilin Flp
MTAMRKTAMGLVADDAGATAIEYALLAALIAGVIIGGALSVGQTLGAVFDKANTELIAYVPDLG